MSAKKRTKRTFKGNPDGTLTIPAGTMRVGDKLRLTVSASSASIDTTQPATIYLRGTVVPKRRRKRKP